jgi:hypothetical protein
MKCKHETDWVFYYPVINEDGWKCVKCNEKLGFRPDLDKMLIGTKVRGLLDDLHTHGLIYVSNGSSGDCIEANVSMRCRETGRFDQYSIILFIMEDCNVGTEDHAKYWKEKGGEVHLDKEGDMCGHGDAGKSPLHVRMPKPKKEREK